MEEMQELIGKLTAHLDNRFPNNSISSKPNSPMFVIYTGAEASNAFPVIAEIIANVWRSSARMISHLIYKDGELLRLKNDGSGEEELEYGVGQVMDEIQRASDCFVKMSSPLIITVESTTDFKGADDFEQMHGNIRAEIEDYLDSYRLIRFVLLNESFKGRKKAKEIKAYIKENGPRGTEYLEKVILYSSLLKDNSLVDDSVNYQLVGSSILVANSAEGDGIFFRGGNPHAITAAYSRIQRPNRGIAVTVVKTLVDWLKKKQSEKKVLGVSEIHDRLQINAGRLPFMDQYYENNVKKALPPVELLEFFPRRNKTTAHLGSMKIDAFREETFGIYDSMIEKLLPFDSDTFKHFREGFRKYLREKISEQEAAYSLIETNVENVINSFKGNREISDKLTAAAYMKEQMVRLYTDKCCEICREEMRLYQKDALNSENILDGIVTELQNDMDSNIGDTVKEFYEKLTQDALDSEAGRQLHEKYKQCGGEKAKLLDALDSFIEELFTREMVFSLPLEEELRVRLGEGNENYHKILQQELMNNIESKARLKTRVALTPQNKIIMANRSEETGQDTELSQFLNGLLSLKDGDVFFDTGNRNLIETIVFYSVDYANL